MSKTQIFVQQADGTAREVEIASGGVLLLNADEHLFIAASSDQAQVETGAPGEVIIKLEGVGEFTVESAEEIPEQIAMAPEVMGIKPLPTIVFEPTRTDLSDDAPTHEPLGVHQARVDSTAFLDRQTGDDFGMSQLLDMAEFSGMAGKGLAGRNVAGDTDEDDMLDDSLDDSLDDGLSADPGQDHPNLPPVIDINTTLLVDDDAMESLASHLRATDRESGPQDLRFRISQGPAYGVLMIDGEEVDATKVTFTQADLDSGRVTFRFDPHAQNKVLVIEGDTFVFRVSDGTHTTGPGTFHIQNTTVQVWGTDNTDGTVGDDLTKAEVDFNRDGVKFHVYGFKGDDTLRGGSGADTLEGDVGQDCADYSDSDSWVNVDLTKRAQSGGGERNHAADDVLIGIENLTGSKFDDSLTGNDLANVLNGLDGNDTLDGGVGDDTLMGGDGTDSMMGGDGNDSMSGGAGNDTLIGEAGHDILYGNDGADSLDGGDGNDTLHGGQGSNTLYGGAGNDSLSVNLSYMSSRNILDGGAGDDTLIGGFGPDTLYGGDGNDSMIAGGLDDGGYNEVMDGGAGNDTLLSDGGNDTLYGGDGNDLLDGGINSDHLIGGDGNDTLNGGDASRIEWIHSPPGYYTDWDLLDGGAGDDVLDGGVGADTLYGGDGNDSLYGGVSTPYQPYVTWLRADNDLLDGGAGNDTLDGGAGNDTLMGGEDNDSLLGGDGNDSMSGDGGDDTLVGGAGKDTLNGGEGVNTVDYRDSTKAVRIDLNQQDGKAAQSGGEAENHAEDDILQNIRNVIGSARADTLIGDSQANVLNGGGGDDAIIAGAGDTVEGGAGIDVLSSVDATLDIVSSTRISGVERVDLAGACKGLTVSGDAILSNGVADPAGSGLMALVVTGDAGDSVARLADGGWAWTLAAPEVTIDGKTYVLYEAAKDGETVRLYVQTGLGGGEVVDGALHIWGTPESDDLTTAWDFNDPRYAFHVHGLDGNDTLRGGINADTLDGGEHASTDVSYPGQVLAPWLTVPGETPGGDTVDYGESGAAVDGVDVDLTREVQSGGHAEGDVLRDIENVTGSSFGDTLRGDGGNNVLAGLAGADLLDGGAGTDTADYRRSDAAVDVDLSRTGGQSGGHAEDDTLAGIENVIGSNHADRIAGDAGHNFLDGGADDDTLLGGASNDTLRGGTGADSLDGGAGTRDLADYSASDDTVDVDLTRTGAQSGGHAEGDTLVGIEDVLGSSFKDVIKGDAKDNRLWGGDGDDTIFGGSGDDTIMGGAGNDTIYGGNDRDTIFGGDGDDYLVGYNPDGSADKDPDLLIGGWGNDTLDASHDTWSSKDRSMLFGGSGADMLIGNGKNTSANYEVTGHGEFEYNYGPGVYLDLRRQGEDADGNWLAQIDPEGRDTDAVGDTLNGIVNAVGSLSSDTIIGNHQDNELYGSDGNDLLIGGEGNDSLKGDDGNDTLEGGAGADLMSGGKDFDMVSYENAAPNNLGLGVLVDLGNQSIDNRQAGTSGAGGEEVGDELWYIDGVIGSAHNDTLIGGSVGDEESPAFGRPYRYAANRLEGGKGDDLLMGLGGADTLDGGEGIDTADYSLSEAEVRVDLNLATAQTGGGEVTQTPSTIDVSSRGILYGGNHACGDVLINIENVTGSGHNDTLIGNNEDNVLSGLAGDDSLVGGGGNDTLIGGAGNDTLQGGDGADLIRAGAGDVVAGGAGHDVLVSEDEYLEVSSSTAITGVERVDLTGACKGLTVSGDAIRDNGVLRDGMKALIVTGDAGDVVAFSDDTWSWAVTGNNQTIEGRIYTVYEGVKDTETVRLYVQEGVTVESATAQGSVSGSEISGYIDEFLQLKLSMNPDQGISSPRLIGNEVPVFDASIASLDRGLELTMHATEGAGYNTSDLIVDDLYISDQFYVIIDVEGPGYNDGFLDFMRSVTADYSDSPASVHVDLNLQDGVTAQSGGDPGNTADGDVLQNIRWLVGSNFDDTIICAKDGGITNIFGEGGNDTIYGDGGAYGLNGGAGDDVLYGGLGHNYRFLLGEAGDDILHLNLNGEDVFGGGTTILAEHIGELDGGDGFDTLVLGGHDGGGVTLDLSGLAKAGTITGIERLDITGDAGDANTLTLKASDVLDTTGGTDTLWVRGDGNDTVTATDSGWTLVGTETGADGQQYNHYSGYAGSTLVNLMIDTDLANQNVVHA